MADKLTEAAKILGQTKKDAQDALRRYQAKHPKIERVRDIFDNIIPFEMEFNTDQQDTIFNLDLYFNKPPPLVRPCVGGRYGMLCKLFSAQTAVDHLLQVDPYVPGSISVFIDNTQTTNFQEYDYKNGLIYVGNTSSADIVICYLQDCAVPCTDQLTGTFTVDHPLLFIGGTGRFIDSTYTYADDNELLAVYTSPSLSDREGLSGPLSMVFTGAFVTNQNFDSNEFTFSFNLEAHDTFYNGTGVAALAISAEPIGSSYNSIGASFDNTVGTGNNTGSINYAYTLPPIAHTGYTIYGIPVSALNGNWTIRVSASQQTVFFDINNHPFAQYYTIFNPSNVSGQISIKIQIVDDANSDILNPSIPGSQFYFKLINPVLTSPVLCWNENG